LLVAVETDEDVNFCLESLKVRMVSLVKACLDFVIRFGELVGSNKALGVSPKVEAVQLKDLVRGVSVFERLYVFVDEF
jgi:hypothetical protein